MAVGVEVLISSAWGGQGGKSGWWEVASLIGFEPLTFAFARLDRSLRRAFFFSSFPACDSVLRGQVLLVVAIHTAHTDWELW